MIQALNYYANAVQISVMLCWDLDLEVFMAQYSWTTYCVMEMNQVCWTAMEVQDPTSVLTTTRMLGLNARGSLNVKNRVYYWYQQMNGQLRSYT